MVKFFSISPLRSDLANYCKKDTYLNCKSDLCSFFHGKDMATIFALPILIAPSNNFRLIKSRIDNSLYTKGKSGGYRLYFYADMVNESVYLLGYYPKTGPSGKSDLLTTELKSLIKTFGEEKETGKLIEHDIAKEFEEKKKTVAKTSQNSPSVSTASPSSSSSK